MKTNWIENTSSTIPKKYHIIFWLSYFTFNVIRWGSYFDDYWYSVKSNLVEFPLHILIVYFHIYVLIPKFVLQKKYKRYVFFLIAALAALYLVRTGLNYLLVTKEIWPEAESAQQAFTFNHIVAVTIGELYVIALVTSLKLAFDWIYELDRVKKIQEVQLTTELNFLKSQIQPHFFFNTLNNLYALSLEKSDVAPSVILKLSDMMQYVLYDVKEPKVRLITAINYINNYIDLERLRFGDSIKSSVDITGEISAIDVPPLLFLPFIENCFKHGVKKNNDVNIEIEFKNIEDKFLEFCVQNTFIDNTVDENRRGIGNKNVRRRLELLYNTNFTLTTTKVENLYKVYLIIPI
ncbi:MAG: histidine kinase [Urechidicola sp.]|nr:histidine kinase [Urechidicola sp.]